MNVTSKLHETLRQPEYTGQNRCPPCTWVNSAIAIVLSAAVGALTAIVTSVAFGVAVGGATLGMSAGAIYFRGYLVPGTPELTMKYFPTWLLRKFDKSPEGSHEPPDTEDVDLEIDPLEGLQASGALEECQDVDDLCLTAAFRRRWHDQFDSLWARNDERAVIAEHFDVDEVAVDVHGYKSAHPKPPDLDEFDIDFENENVIGTFRDDEGNWKVETVERESNDDGEAEMPPSADDGMASPPADETTSPPPDGLQPSPSAEEPDGDVTDEQEAQYTVSVGNNPPARWPSREALFAEIAAADVLEDGWDWSRWANLDDTTQAHLAAGLRLFLDRCPSCGTDLTQSEESVESCCGSKEVFAVACEDCDSRIYENQLQPEGVA